MNEFGGVGSKGPAIAFSTGAKWYHGPKKYSIHKIPAITHATTTKLTVVPFGNFWPLNATTKYLTLNGSTTMNIVGNTMINRNISAMKLRAGAEENMIK